MVVQKEVKLKRLFLSVEGDYLRAFSCSNMAHLFTCRLKQLSIQLWQAQNEKGFVVNLPVGWGYSD